MDTVNWILIALGEAARWCGGGVQSVAVEAGHWLHAILQPLLSPLLGAVNPALTAVGDAVFSLMRPFPAWVGLTVLSVLTGVVALLVFRLTSNQAAISRALDDIKANLLALKLFKDELGVTFRCQARLAGAIGRLQWHMLRPCALMAIPMLPALAQMGTRYQWRPLRPGETAQIRIPLEAASEDQLLDIADIRLEDRPGLVVEVPAVPGGGSLVWRVRAAETGRHVLTFRVADQTVEKEFVVSDGRQRVSLLRTAPDWTSQLLHPIERPLAAAGSIRSIQITYPSTDSWITGADNWLITFFVVSMLTAIILKPIMGVRF